MSAEKQAVVKSGWALKPDGQLRLLTPFSGSVDKQSWINNYSRVQLLKNKYQQEGVGQGAVGYVIEIYDNGDCEVEFSKSDGITFAQIVASPNDLKVDTEQAVTTPKTPEARVSREKISII